MTEQVFRIRPTGWETDPEEEIYPFSTLDYLVPRTYNGYAIFFRFNDAKRSEAIAILRAGLERTLSQTRHLCGTIEKISGGSYAFVKKKESTVQFFVQSLDAPEFPSLDDIEKRHFTAVSLGEYKTWIVPSMKWGKTPEADPNSHPVAAAFKADFVRGGLVFVMHSLHYANDALGWAGCARQLAENCYAHANKAPFPPWDSACLDVSRVAKPEPPEDQKVDGPPEAWRHSDHSESVSLLFHLPKSKAAALKELLKPSDGSWISTYDAFSALLWRTITRLRAPVFKPDPSSSLFWLEGVDMRRRFRNPTVPERMQRNVVAGISTALASVPQPTVAQVISEWTLSELATYVRRMTDSVSQEFLDLMLEQVAAIRDKVALNMLVESQPPMAVSMTDHRDASMIGYDFGFATPVAHRHLFGAASETLVMVYPSRNPSPESDEGCELSIAYEKRLAKDLIRDPEWRRWFEYRGVDVGQDVDDLSPDQFETF